MSDQLQLFKFIFDVIIYPWPKCKVCLSKLCWKNMSQMCIESVSPVWAIDSLVLQKPFTECITLHFNLSSPGLAWIHAYIMNKTWKYEHGLIFCSLRHILNDNMRISFRKCVVQNFSALNKIHISRIANLCRVIAQGTLGRSVGHF